MKILLITISLSTLFAQDDDLEDYKLTDTELMGYQKLANTQCIGIDGYDADLVRDYVGSAKDCKALCDTYENCAGFVRVNGPKTSQFYGKCYLRADGLQTPFPYTGDDRDCYRSVRYIRNKGDQCTGTAADILRDYQANTLKCGRKCDSMDDCVGFVRVRAGSQYAGKCYFRGGSLNAPQRYTMDNRDCYEPDQRIRKTASNHVVYVDENELFAQDADLEDYKLTDTELMGYQKLANTQCIGIDGYDADLVRDYVGSAKDCKALCDTYENCAGFVRVNGPKTSQFYGKCYLRADGLQTPFPYTGDDRDCYKSVRYIRNKGDQCTGTATDILRDYQANTLRCARKCDSMDDCVGFVRVKAGSQYAGKCYFRGGSLNAPQRYTMDRRDCYEPDQRVRKTASDHVIYVDEIEYMVNHGYFNGLIGSNDNPSYMIMCVLLGLLLVLFGYKIVMRVCEKWRVATKSATVTTPLIKNENIKV